jgi:hypothetical protein
MTSSLEVPGHPTSMSCVKKWFFDQIFSEKVKVFFPEKCSLDSGHHIPENGALYVWL